MLTHHDETKLCACEYVSFVGSLDGVTLRAPEGDDCACDDVSDAAKLSDATAAHLVTYSGKLHLLAAIVTK